MTKIYDSVRAANSALVSAKRDELLAERKRLMDQRAEILSQIRRNDRELSDCRATARFFGLDIEFPDEDGPPAERSISHLQRELELSQHRLLREAQRIRSAAPPMQHQLASASPTITVVPSAALPSQEKPKSRPPLRQILLEQLERAGTSGAKAAPLREFIERTYGEVLHEKSVGMTLYRLLKDGLVRRDGHNWFFVPQAETKNPGGETPGSTSSSN